LIIVLFVLPFNTFRLLPVNGNDINKHQKLLSFNKNPKRGGGKVAIRAALKIILLCLYALGAGLSYNSAQRFLNPCNNWGMIVGYNS
jgi:hypothetical protein